MSRGHIKGTAKSTTGETKEAAGGSTGDTNTRTEGLLNQVEGAAQNAYGQANDVVGEAARISSAGLAEAFEAGASYYASGNQAVRQVSDNALAALLMAGAASYPLAEATYGQR
jgi:uncharacterized protein YjbJ (UPF0337 family)